jgi:hypothetical protein
MSLTDVKVELGLNLLTLGSPGFILDSTSDGLLGVSRLFGLEFYDVTQFVTSVSINRGRSRQLDYFNAGSATVTFDNRGREFDPSNESSPYYPAILPRCLMRVEAKGKPLFYGVVNDWDVDYGLVDNDFAVAKCSDAFAVLSNMELSAFTPSAQKTGARINAVLDRSEVKYAGGRQIGVGLSDLGAYAVAANTNVLNYLRQIDKSELGFLFVAGNGNLIFLGRGDVYTNEIVLFADDSSGVPYQSLVSEYGDELLYNVIEVDSPAGSPITVSDTSSINKYQRSKLSQIDLLNSSTGVLTFLANSLLTKYKEPEVRLTGFTVQTLGLDDDLLESVLGIDLVSYVEVKKSFSVGLPASRTDFSFISGISHNIRPGSHTISFSVEQALGTLYLVLGGPVAGKLDYAAFSS